MTDPLIGTITRTTGMPGIPFGTITDVRRSHRTGQGWHEFEYLVDVNVDRLHCASWIDGNKVEPATLDDVLNYYTNREEALMERIKKLRNMVGTKVPKFNPDKHLGGMAHRMTAAFRHEDGSITYVMTDPDPVIDSPRTYDGNVATLIQTNTRCIDVDDDDEGLREAHERFEIYNERSLNGWSGPGFMMRHIGLAVRSKYDREAMMRRYLSIFRPEVIYYTERWSGGDSCGWGYVTREKWEAAMGEDYDGDVTPEQAFDQEVRIYGLWAEGEVYSSAHIAEKGGEVDFVGGHLGYDNDEQIAAYHTDSPVLEVLA